MSTWAGTGPLVRTALRRDRVLLPAWIAVFVLTAASSAVAAVDLYPDVASRTSASDSLNSSQALVALYGRIYDPASLGGIGTIKLGGFGSVMVALLAIVVVVRHTRGDEDAGRMELLGATALGRRAVVTSALIVAVGANVLLGALTAAGLAGSGLPLGGSLAFGAAWAGAGIAFAAIAALVAQVASTARATRGICFAVLGAVYAVRAVGDAADATGPRWLSWLSPIGWAQQFRPYAGDRWWVLSITLAFAVAVVAVAVVLAGRRDLGAGMFATRPGRATAAAALRSPLALAWRIQRGSVAGWLVGFALMGVLLGAIASSVGDFINNPAARDFIAALGGEQGLIDAFLAVELAFAGIFASAFGVQSVLRLRAEEDEQRAEPVLATAVSRLRWAGSHLMIAVAGTTVLMVVVGVGAGIARAAASGDADQIVRVVLASLAQLPAAWVLVAIAVALFGLAPRWVTAAWAVLAGFVLLGELGPLFDLDQVVLDLSPFAHTPKLPGGAFSAAPLVLMCAVALVGTTAGLVAFRRRDLT